jgi:cytochrome c oxidase assembly factor CtaG
VSAWLQPPLIATVAFAVLYVFGARRRHKHRLWRAAPFFAALALAELVLCPPFDRLADESLGLHMLQHVVLMSFVAPLVVLAAPWLTVWRGLPLALRRPVARRVIALPAVVRRGLRGLASPWPAWLLVNVDIGIWHVPWLYDLTLSNEAVHDVEHLSFLLFGILFWLPVLESPPLHARLDGLRGALYVTAGAAPGWILALVLALATRPLYPAYAALSHRWASLSALGDQQLAAGVMIGIGSIPFTVAVFVLLYRWLDAPDLRGEPLGLVRAATESLLTSRRA